MIDPAGGSFLFDTSADSYFDKTSRQADRNWLRAYTALSPGVEVSAGSRGAGTLACRVPTRRDAWFSSSALCAAAHGGPMAHGYSPRRSGRVMLLCVRLLR